MEIRFISGWIGADLMPAIPPDPIMCQIVLLLQNKSESETVRGISFPGARVFLSSSHQRLGQISFSTDWDGEIEPAIADTVRLTKLISSTTLFNPPCDKYVYLELIILQPNDSTRTFKTDNLLFACAH